MFDNRNVIITGGSSGLGRALARRLAGRGANLALIARDKGKLESTQRELSPLVGASREVLIYSCDVSDPTQVDMTARLATGAAVASTMKASFSRDIRSRSVSGLAVVPTMRVLA